MRWTFRRGGSDIVKLYDALAPLMQLATGGDMLNFGLWQKGSTFSPREAQDSLCLMIGELAEMGSTPGVVVDLGSGLCAPALKWKSHYPHQEICCVNINFSQLVYARRLHSALPSGGQGVVSSFSDTALSMVNSNASELPFADSSISRLIALESAQHFRPFAQFVRESERVLGPGGLLVIAIPIRSRKCNFLRLGMLSLTWSSEHYTGEFVRTAIQGGSLQIESYTSIGRSVYQPLAEYYVRNRKTLRGRILQRYLPVVEWLLYRSILKMNALSREGMIDYVLIKARKRSL